jgi:hypothetical protein
LSDDDAKFIAEASGQYPLMITTVCGCINLTKQDAHALCRSFQVGPGDIKTRANERLRDIINFAVQVMRVKDPIAVEMLACISCHSLRRILGADSLYFLVMEFYGTDDGPRAYSQAMQTLRNSFLLRFESMSLPFADSENEVVRMITMHPVVKAILRRLLSDVTTHVASRLPEIVERLYSEFCILLAEYTPVPARSTIPAIRLPTALEPAFRRLHLLTSLRDGMRIPLAAEAMRCEGWIDVVKGSSELEFVALARFKTKQGGMYIEMPDRTT